MEIDRRTGKHTRFISQNSSNCLNKLKYLKTVKVKYNKLEKQKWESVIQDLYPICTAARSQKQLNSSRYRAQRGERYVLYASQQERGRTLIGVRPLFAQKVAFFLVRSQLTCHSREGAVLSI
jgi:hypothetical protein